MEVMESDLTCCVCLEIFVYPLMLPCTHNLCRRCVQGLTSNGAATEFNCPKCRLEIQVERRTGINSLPRNLALDNLANLFRNKARISAEKMCNTHDKSLDFYCQTCKCLICSDCTSSKHNDFPHNVASIKQLIAEEKNSVQDLTEQMNDTEAELNKNIRTVQRFMKDIKASEEANCNTIEQSLGQLTAAINTMKDAFVKKIQHDSQQQIDHLDSLEQDYRRLQLDICALRSQIGCQDKSALIQQYTAYQNIKMRVSSFLAFKLFKVAAPPQSQPAQPLWRLHNAQHVYQAIQALDVRKESLSPISKYSSLTGTSKSLPASPKHFHKPSLHEQNSEGYNSDNEGPGQGRSHAVSAHNNAVFKNARFTPNLPAQNTFNFARHAFIGTDGQQNITPFGGENSSFTFPQGNTSAFPYDVQAQKQTYSTQGEAYIKSRKLNTVSSLHPAPGVHNQGNSFGSFMNEYKINSSNFLGMQDKDRGRYASLPSQKDGKGAESVTVDQTSNLRESSAGDLCASWGAIPKQSRNIGFNWQVKGRDSSHGKFAFTMPFDTKEVQQARHKPIACHESSSEGAGIGTSGFTAELSAEPATTTSCEGATSSLFADQNFSFTVGSSDKGRRSRSNKGQRRRDQSTGRSLPKQTKT